MISDDRPIPADKSREYHDHANVPAEIQGRIGRHLRRVYGDVMAEPLPDKLRKLIEELAMTERSE